MCRTFAPAFFYVLRRIPRDRLKVRIGQQAGVVFYYVVGMAGVIAVISSGRDGVLNLVSVAAGHAVGQNRIYHGIDTALAEGTHDKAALQLKLIFPLYPAERAPSAPFRYLTEAVVPLFRRHKHPLDPPDGIVLRGLDYLYLKHIPGHPAVGENDDSVLTRDPVSEVVHVGYFGFDCLVFCKHNGLRKICFSVCGLLDFDLPTV